MLLTTGNKKISKQIATFNLPVSTCLYCTPWCAKYCYAKRGHYCYKQTKNKYHNNLNIVNMSLGLFKAITINEIENINPMYIRVHCSGDFHSQAYFNVWCKIASENPSIVFVAYTKNYTLNLSDKPSNFILRLSLDSTSSNDAINNIDKFDSIAYAYARKEFSCLYNNYFICKNGNKCITNCNYCYNIKNKYKNVVFMQH